MNNNAIIELSDSSDKQKFESDQNNSLRNLLSFPIKLTHTTPVQTLRCLTKEEARETLEAYYEESGVDAEDSIN